MPQPEIIRFSSDVALAEAVANEWLQIVPTASEPAIPWLVALSGGRIVRRFFEAAVKRCKEQALSLDPVHFFWGDERCVPPNDAESNYAIARKYLFDPLKIPEQTIHRIRGEDPPDIAARAAAVELQRITSASANDVPILDLIFLGMGEDGHVPSLFPGESPAAVDSPAVYRPEVGTTTPPNSL